MSILKGVPVLLMLMSMLMATADARPKDGYDLWGCHDGYCWAACFNPFAYQPWCYTTKGARYKGDYIKCTENYECQYTYSCGGICGY